MKNLLALALCAAVALYAGGTTRALAQQHDHKAEAESGKAAKQVALQGEVLDLYCFMAHPENGQGPDHAKCAKACIEKGLPVGFLSNGDVYLITGKDHESVKDVVAPFAGAQSKLTGTVVEHHGIKAIELASIEPVSAAKKEAGK